MLFEPAPCAYTDGLAFFGPYCENLFSRKGLGDLEICAFSRGERCID